MGRAAGLGEVFDELLKPKFIIRLGCVVGQEPRPQSLRRSSRCAWHGAVLQSVLLAQALEGARGAEPDGIHEEDSDGPRLQRVCRRRSVQIAGGRGEGLAAARSLQVERSCAPAQRSTWNALSVWHDIPFVCKHLSYMAPTASEAWRRPLPGSVLFGISEGGEEHPTKGAGCSELRTREVCVGLMPRIDVWDVCRG